MINSQQPTRYRKINYRIPVPPMSDNMLVYGKYVYLNAGKGRYYVYDLRTPLLGKGGMGEVMRGYDCLNGQPVAIKRILDKYTTIPEVRRKARVESALTFSHPNIVEMLGCCELRSGTGPFFIISRYVEGQNIDKFIKINSNVFSGSERAHRIVKMLLPVLDALEYLHRQHIYHLDIKPSNIMVDQHSTAHIMDLGIANTTIATAGFSANEYGVLGTPRYAAPEQFKLPGETSEVSAQSDIYEMGVTMYELITEYNPFTGNSLREIAEKHFNGYLPHIASTPEPIIKVLQRATELRAADRYPSALAMKEALTKAIEPQQNRSLWPFSRK